MTWPPVRLWLLVALSTYVYAETSSQQAQTAWANRDQAGQTEKAIHLWQEALKENPTQATLWIPLTQALGRQVRHTTDSAEKKKWADLGREAGEQAVAKNPQSAEAWAYNAEAIGQWANLHKGTSSLKKVKQAVAALKKALEINPHYAYAHMLLAEFYRQAPSVISVGDKKKALAEAEAAVTDDPTHAINHIAYARALIDNNQREKAIAQLRQVLTLPAPPDAVPETKSDQETAHELLHELGATETTAASSTTGMACTVENTSNGATCGH